MIKSLYNDYKCITKSLANNQLYFIYVNLTNNIYRSELSLSLYIIILHITNSNLLFVLCSPSFKIKERKC